MWRPLDVDSSPVFKREGEAVPWVRMRVRERCSGDCGGLLVGVPAGLPGLGDACMGRAVIQKPTSNVRHWQKACCLRNAAVKHLG